MCSLRLFAYSNKTLIMDAHDTQIVRLTRILKLIQELQLRPKQTPKELCEKLGIKKATFHSDKTLLSKAGFSWCYNRASQTYILEGENILPMLNLTLTEALAIVVAVRHFSGAGDISLIFEALSGIKKLIAATPNNTRNFLFSLLGDILSMAFQATPKLIDALIEAQKSHRCMVIAYDDRSQKRTMHYEIAPYQLFFQARALYLDCYILEEKRIAMLRVSRIKKIEKYTSTFEVLSDYSFTERHKHTFRAIRRDGQPQTVRLLFDKEVADLIRESFWHSSEKKLDGVDGRICLELAVSEPKEVLWYLVMPYAQQVKILEPKWLEDEFISIAQTVINKFKTKQS